MKDYGRGAFRNMSSIKIIIATLLLLLNVSAFSAEQAGTLLGLKGDVRAVGESGDRALLRSDSVFEGDLITTGANSYAVVEFVDGAKATIRPNSELKIESYQFNRSQDGALLNLVKGGLRAVTGQIAHNKPESFKVKTNVATLGVRGTEFYLRICEEDCAAEQATHSQNLFVEKTRPGME
jgi:hypothetical protein